MSSYKEIICHEENEDTRPDHATPVHLRWIWVWTGWEELEYPKHTEEAQSNDVDYIAGFAKVEARRREFAGGEPLVKHA